MRAEIREQAFDPYAELAAFRGANAALAPACGGEAVFIGTMRNHNGGVRVLAMELEHYPAMTRRYLGRIGTEALAQFDVEDCLILHRVGRISPGETIVVVAAWAAHRDAAFAACRYLIEELKARAPFWKKEVLATGATRWVDRNTPAATSPGHAA